MSEFRSQIIEQAHRIGRTLTKAEVIAVNGEYAAWATKEITSLRQQLEQAEAQGGQGAEPVAYLVECDGLRWAHTEFKEAEIQAMRLGVDVTELYTHPLPAQHWEPSAAEYDRAIHHNPDAKAWADLFMQTFPSCGADHETMLGWFANAMMAMYDHVHTKKPAQQADELEAKTEVAPVYTPEQLAITPENIRVDAWSRYRGSWGIRVENGVRVTHIPTGIVVEEDGHRSQHRNKARALEILEERLKELGDKGTP